MEGFEEFQNTYHRGILKKLFFILFCLIMLLVTSAISVTIGTYEITVWEVYQTIFNHLIGNDPEQGTREWNDLVIVWQYRLPRVAFAALAGFGLAVAGTAMQGVMKNPLAEPYTTGVSSGAYLGVAMSMCLGITIGAYGDMVSALILALVPVCIIALAASKVTTSVATIILLGTALSYMFNALSTFILVNTDVETLAEVYRWQVGSVAGLTWDELAYVALTVFAGSIGIFVLSSKLNIMAVGDENAKSLGVNVNLIRAIILVIIAAIVAAIVVYAGIIGFVGLICPHIVRMLIGSDNRYILPAAAMFGASFLLAADTIAKYISSFDTLPVGAVASLIGAPIFLYILINNRRGIW